jgi:hypothetical protein
VRVVKENQEVVQQGMLNQAEHQHRRERLFGYRWISPIGIIGGSTDDLKAGLASSKYARIRACVLRRGVYNARCDLRRSNFDQVQHCAFLPGHHPQFIQKGYVHHRGSLLPDF